MSSKNRIEQLKVWAKEDPKDPFPGYGIALELKNNGDTSLLSHLQEHVAAFPNYFPSWQMIGLLYLEQGQANLAVETLEKAHALAFEQRELKAAQEIKKFITEIQTQAYD